MSEWGEKARARFDPGDYATPLASYLGGVSDLRNHLLSEETVERVARTITPGLYYHYDEWDDATEEDRAQALKMARNALTAALGEDEDDE